ncbi:hypothetical protein IQ265_19680 [Nodosilinea sp. LEGE 06152]|uniref:hypothetical protein n=1 Tax=Nodosilinea sp. LEGE 06152 TaxID=2777966 RepID=UPI0018828CAF|nr:hypothetical protein [Nodosilinea sp. LEGE 06152]MBE9159039.1 hypothetical protein [Nodosilinea sp. LEGE 06152]
MKPNSLYAQLELIQEPLERSAQSDYAIGRVWAGAKARLCPWASRLVVYLCGSNSLRVTVKRIGYRSVLGGDREGQTVYVVYDPVTQQRHTFSSEHDLRVWADQRYYQ